MKTNTFNTQLKRNQDSAVAAGVCAGLADYLQTDRTLVRIGAVVCGVLLTKITIVAYGAAWLLLEDR